MGHPGQGDGIEAFPAFHFAGMTAEDFCKTRSFRALVYNRAALRLPTRAEFASARSQGRH
jgi:hypothetical protein